MTLGSRDRDPRTLKKIIEQQQETIQDLQEQIKNLQDNYVSLREQIVDEKENRALGDKDIHKRIEELEQKIEDIQLEGKHQSQSKLKKIKETSDEELQEEYSPSEYRAIKIWLNFSDWCIATKKGYILKSDSTKKWPDKLDEILTKSRGEAVELDRKQLYRAMEKVEDISNGEIVYKERRKKGRRQRILISQK